MPLPPWPLNLSAHNKKIQNALQVQYEVHHPEDGIFKVQAWNVFSKPARESGEPVELEESVFDAVTLVTKKQWLLQILWEDGVRGAHGKRLTKPDIGILGWYVLYYEHVLDALFLTGQGPDLGPLKRWVTLERSTPHSIHTPDIAIFIKEQDLEDFDLAEMLINDPWGVEAVFGISKLSALGPKEISETLRNMVDWIREHERHRESLLINLGRGEAQEDTQNTE